MSTRFRSTSDVIIRTGDLEAAARFYGSVLGLPVARKTDHMVRVDTGAFTLYVERGDTHGPVFELLVPSVAEAKAHLLARGCRLLEEDAAVPRCYVQDPYGFTFNIGQAG